MVWYGIIWYDRDYVCPFDGCPAAFKRSDALGNHIKKHTMSTEEYLAFKKKWKCDICEKRLSSKVSLRNHNKQHEEGDYGEIVKKKRKKERIVFSKAQSHKL